MTILDHDPDFPKPGLYCEVDSVQSLADSMANSTEKSIYEPSWPSEAFRTRYVLDFDHEDRGYAIYHILTRVPDHPDPLIVRGSPGSINPDPHLPEWRPIAELAEINAWARTEDGPGPQVIAAPGGMNLQLTFRSTEEAIIAAHSLREIPNEGQSLFTWMGNFDDGDQFANAQALADAIGVPVHEPTWPDYAGPRQYVVAPRPPWESSPTFTNFSVPPAAPNYDILAITPDEESIIIVHGALGSSFKDGQDGWWAVRELAHLKGIATTENNPAEIVVEISEMTVSLCGFPSIHDAIQAALSLYEYRPRN